MSHFDVIIIGSGLAGMTLALNLAESQRVAIVTKRGLLDGASDWAQGGIAAVLADDDSIEEHVRDTLIAGAGLCDEQATRFVAENGRAAIEWLIEQGVPFSRDAGNATGYHLTREGGHSHRRISTPPTLPAMRFRSPWPKRSGATPISPCWKTTSPST